MSPGAGPDLRNFRGFSQNVLLFERARGFRSFYVGKRGNQQLRIITKITSDYFGEGNYKLCRLHYKRSAVGCVFWKLDTNE